MQTAAGATVWILRHPESGAFSRLSPEGWQIWQRLDGRHTLKDIVTELFELGHGLSPELVAATIAEIARARLVRARPLARALSDAGEEVGRWRRMIGAARRVLEWRVPWTHADRLLAWIYDHGGRVLLTRGVLVLSAAITVAGCAAFFHLYGRVAPLLEDARGSRAVLLFLYPSPWFALLLHEFGHGLVVRHFGPPTAGRQ